MNLSIITPSFNSASYISECLNSIKCDTVTKYEVIVVDNCSVDETASKVLSARKANFSLNLISQRDSGPAQAINYGFRVAKGDIIGWINSDDYYAKGAIDRALKMFADDPKLVMVYGLGHHVDIFGDDLGPYPTLDPATNIKKFANGSFVCQPTVFLRKEVFSVVGFLNQKLKTAFDFDFWLRIWNHYPRKRIGFVDSVQAFSRLHDQCLTKRFRQTVALESMAVIAHHLGSAPSHWVLTYIDEICSRYPFIEEQDSLVDLVKQILTKSKSYISPPEFEKLVKNLQEDWRFRLANKQAFINVQPDGWVGKKAIVKLKYSVGEPTLLKLACRGGWPIEGNLNIKITSSNGALEKVRLGSQDEFTLNLVAPKTDTTAFMTWTIETRQFFIPSETNKRSKDSRELSFRVENLTLA